MKQWTNKERYRTYQDDDLPEVSFLHERVMKSRWRTQFHVQTPAGLLNDPNGFCFWNGRWHLFYQWFPFGAVHGMKHWYHVSSDDLVTWKNEGIALKPSRYEERNGCYSGCAYPDGDELYLVYTGNCKDDNNVRFVNQLMAKMDVHGTVTKREEPLIPMMKEFTEHQRDPKVFRHLGYYYTLLGVQDHEGHGKLAMLKAQDIDGEWELIGELKVRGYDHFGYMCECPDIEKVGNNWLLLFSPQGIEAEGDRYHNKFNNVYLTGKMDFDKLEFIPDGEMREIDLGFDFYAAQCAFQREYSNTAILEGWIGVPDYTYPPTDEEGWSGLLTMPRELTVKDGKLIQKPVRKSKKLREEVVFRAVNGSIIEDRLFARTPEACVIDVDNPGSESLQLNLFAGPGTSGFEIIYDRRTQMFCIRRDRMVNLVNTEYGTERKVKLEKGLKQLEIFVDHSVVEIFVNQGEYVLTSRVFPTEAEHLLRLGGKDINITISKAAKTVEDDLVL